MSNKQWKILLLIGMVFGILSCQGGTLPAISTPESHLSLTVPALTSTPGTQSAVSPTPTAPDSQDALWYTYLQDSDAICIYHRERNGQTCLDQEGWHTYQYSFSEMVFSCPDGHTYLGTDDNYLILTGEETTEIPDLSPYSLISAACSPEAGFWAITTTGIGQFDGRTWTEYPFDALITGSYPDDYRGIGVTPEGTVWIASRTKIMTFEGASWQEIRNADEIYDLEVDHAGQVWVLCHSRTEGRQLMRFSNGSWETWPGLEAEAMWIDPQNQLWVLNTDHTLSIFDQPTSSWQVQTSEDAFLGAEINDLQFDALGRMWVATSYGVYVNDNDSWVAYHMYSADLLDEYAEALLVIGDGPPLPPLRSKPPGTVHGVLSNPDPNTTPYQQVELCVGDHIHMIFSGDSPCAGDEYHQVVNANEEGEFTFQNVPVGRYHLAIQLTENNWHFPTGSYFQPIHFYVLPGETTELNVISYSP